MATQTIVIRPPKARFSLGQVVMTVGVDSLIRQGQIESHCLSASSPCR